MAKILEHNTKELIRKHGISVPEGIAIATPEEVYLAAARLKPPYMVKALLPKGKKGKAGLVLEARDADAAAEIARKLIGHKEEGLIVQKVYLEEKIAIKKERFVSITYDNLAHAPVILFSPQGGVEIEELAVSHPRLIFRHSVDILEGFYPYQARALCFKAGLEKEEAIKTSETLVSLYHFFIESDARLLEINPLCLTETGHLVAAGALLNIDDEALFRHPEFEAITSYGLERIMGDLNEREKWVLEADLAAPGSGAVRYTEFEGGDIAIIVAGGGASLVIGDAIRRKGAYPANYSDLGPGKGAFTKMLVLIKAALSNPAVRAVFTGCAIATADDVGRAGAAVADAIKASGIDPLKIPVVARWAGRNDQVGRKAWQAVSGSQFFGDEITIEEAAERVVELLRARENEEG
jgi:succinyl-CoA synthetase beta subunit